MMTKLYKDVDNFLHYWEIWDNKNVITIHWGKLGETGDSKNINVKFYQNLNKIVKNEIAKTKSDGYYEIPQEKHFQLIVQFKIGENFGTEDDLDKQQKVENLLNEALGWTGNGYCDGGDIGSGTMNIFSFVIEPGSAQKTVIEKLTENKIFNDFIIAIRKDEDIKIVYPENYQGEFQY